MSKPTEIVLQPIGVVRSPVKEVADDCWGGIVSTIELDAKLFDPDCTLGLNEYSHAEILFLLDKISPEKGIAGARRPRGRADWPNMGIFAHGSKHRPNRLGVTVCEIESGTRLQIRVRQ